MTSPALSPVARPIPAMAVEAPPPYLPPEWAQWQGAPAYYVAAPPQPYYGAPHQAAPPPGWIPSAAAYVARVPPPMAVPGRGHPGGPYAVYTAQQQQQQQQGGQWGGAQQGPPPAPPAAVDARQQGLPPRAPSPGGYGVPRAAAPGGYGAQGAVGPVPSPSSSFEHAHLARRNARLEERLADAAREKREMAAHFEQLLAQVRVQGGGRREN